MSRGGIRWWLLAEDPNHERFALELARRAGLNTRPVKVYISPSGVGAASAWVREQYPRLARATVRIRPGERVVFLVMIDGDHEGVEQRKRLLDDALRTHDESARLANEPILVFVPTWSIETWLAGRVSGLSESVSMKLQVRSPSAADFEQAVRRVTNLAVDEPLVSVRDAAGELRRARL